MQTSQGGLRSEFTSGCRNELMASMLTIGLSPMVARAKLCVCAVLLDGAFKVRIMACQVGRCRHPPRLLNALHHSELAEQRLSLLNTSQLHYLRSIGRYTATKTTASTATQGPSNKRACLLALARRAASRLTLQVHGSHDRKMLSSFAPLASA